MPVLNLLVSLFAPLLKMWGIHYTGKLSERKDTKIEALEQRMEDYEEAKEIDRRVSSMSDDELDDSLRSQ